MNTKQIQYALALSETLSFSQTAEQLCISQPALSKQILHLENDLGVKLFDRNHNPLTLTPAGEYFVRNARDLVYREEQLYRSMEAYRDGSLGRLVIGISPFRALYLMPRLCKQVKEKFPGVKIVLQEDNSDLLRRNAAEGKYDFAIANLPVDESVLDVIPIEQDTLVLVVPKAMKHLLKVSSKEMMPQVDISTCRELPFVVVGQNQEMRRLFDRICTAADLSPHIAMEVVGLATAWTMAKTGIGATLLPLQFVRSMDFEDSVELFVPKCDTNIRQPAIITRHGQYLSDYARYAIDVLSGK